jgi:gamma-glutamyltranspeptidase
MVYDHKTKKSEVIDFQETAPSSADLFKGDKSLIEKVIILISAL